ncbi:MAG: DUF499 domain-containing protein [Actinomycetota bacterium]|nr:DUF499 domain-containing protein [Actinomycetota bacterium]
MKPWWQITTPHRDIREGRLDEAVFAADLGDVAQGKGPIDYRDPETFFRKTYVTKGLENLVESVLSRLAGKGKGEGVIQLQTPFGGGKTHSLVALYHLIKSREKVSHFEAIRRILGKIGIDEIPKAKVAVFDGTHIDPVKGRTPWGEIAHQIGFYELVKEHDEKRVTPGKDILTELLSKSGPTLIIMDEFHHYVTKIMRVEELEKTQKGQVLAFLRELTVAAPALENCVLVVTLPSSRLEAYDEAGEQALARIQKISGRVEAIYTPVEGEEVYEIIRKRLFEDVGDPETHRLVADEYFDLYQRLGEDIPAEAKEAAYRDKIRKAYPFHPESIDVLFERWGSISTFQRTRGVLRLLAEVVADLYKKEHPSPLIQPAHIDFRDRVIRREFIKHIGNEYESVIASDIADGGAKAQKIDREMGTEYARHGVATGLAGSIFFYSFGGGEKRGVSLQRLRLAFLREGIPSAIVGDALRRIEEELWFLHSDKSLFYFTNQPNLNRVIIDKEETVKDDEIEKEIRKIIEEIAGSDFAVFLWPEASNDIPDDKRVKLAILAPSHATGNSPEELLKALATRYSSGFRAYKNTLLFLLAGSGEFEGLKRIVLRSLALRRIKEDGGFLKSLSDENRKTLERKLKEASESIPFMLLNAYRHLAKVKEGEVVFFDLGLPTVGEKALLTRRVKDYLKEQELLLEKVSPRYLMEKTFAEGEERKTVRDIWEAFLKFSHLPLLEDEDVLKRTIVEGVRSKTLGLVDGEEVYYGDDMLETQFDEEAEVARSELAEKLKGRVVTEVREVGEEVEKEKEEKKKGKPGAVKTIRISARIPWDKLSDFMSGVILPLQQDGAEIELEVQLSAKSESGISKNTLELKTKETLNQIRAQILDWKEEE